MEEQEPDPTGASVFRCWTLLVPSLALLLLGVVILIARVGDAIGAMIVTIYALQALAVEALGVKLSGVSVSIPRRVFAVPVLTLGRRKISLKTINSVYVLPKTLGSERVQLRLASGSRASIFFTTAARRRLFLRQLRKSQPDLSIYRRT